MLTSIFIKAQLLLPQVFLFGANKSTILKKIGGLTKDASDFLIPICTLILVVVGICFMFGDGGRRIGKGMGIGAAGGLVLGLIAAAIAGMLKSTLA
ncbi:hypothetical protein D4W23_14650 [Listeria monocytogenes]|nr:hypothetical protein [Listeria monocytogenes]EAH0860818.1 hypothetical protein [Listeria monocytogenes]EAH2539454.1 hypothetical protein [Listeria monocytogenes]EAH3147357.1 hypothetical protein [Listeria monocytogenes]